MEETNVYKDSWEETLRNKTKEELVNMVQHKDKYAPEFIRMVETKLEKEFGVKAVESKLSEENPSSEKRGGSEWELIKAMGGFLSLSKWLVVCILLGIFAFLSGWQAGEEFSAWKPLDGYWWSFATLCSVSILFFLIKGKVESYLKAKKSRISLNSLSSNPAQIGTRDLFLETLTKIGCQYEIEEGEDGDIHFGFQGEYFTVRANNECAYVQIWDLHWGHVELYDIDELARLKKAINESNLRNSVTAVYTVDEDGKKVDVHCRSVILFVPEIQDLTGYLRIELNEFFRSHETINVEMAKQREQENRE